ncbi:protein of unknown function [Methylorubrum extorquens]|uniref:Uncharacterized protein n=1 Tax=Methylorubrum extorquens TaxID=408 RepID=A0A2N9APZ7_METEX|nr:protein of unknown function [Methylorubrum extorquens]
MRHNSARRRRTLSECVEPDDASDRAHEVPVSKIRAGRIGGGTMLQSRAFPRIGLSHTALRPTGSNGLTGDGSRVQVPHPSPALIAASSKGGESHPSVPIPVRSRRRAERVAPSDRLGRNLNDEPFGPWKRDRPQRPGRIT